MESEPDPTDELWFYAAAPPDTRTYVDLGNLTVDGETFAVRNCADDHATHYNWISGPNDGYGFSTFGGPEPLSLEQRLDRIRGFLAGIDPATGYLG